MATMQNEECIFSGLVHTLLIMWEFQLPKPVREVIVTHKVESIMELPCSFSHYKAYWLMITKFNELKFSGNEGRSSDIILHLFKVYVQQYILALGAHCMGGPC